MTLPKEVTLDWVKNNMKLYLDNYESKETVEALNVFIDTSHSEYIEKVMSKIIPKAVKDKDLCMIESPLDGNYTTSTLITMYSLPAIRVNTKVTVKSSFDHTMTLEAFTDFEDVRPLGLKEFKLS